MDRVRVAMLLVAIHLKKWVILLLSQPMAPPPLPRQADQYLMEIFARYKPSINQMKALNRCRLYLKVITLSDITTADGSRLLISARRGNIGKNSQTLWREVYMIKHQILLRATLLLSETPAPYGKANGMTPTEAHSMIIFLHASFPYPLSIDQ